MSKANRILLMLFSAVVLSVTYYSCTKVDELIDANDVLSYNISAVTPENVRLGKTYIQNDTIFIPVIYGLYSLPIKVSGTMSFSDNIYKTLRYKNGDDILFTNVSEDPNVIVPSVFEFFVMAESGATKPYHIALDVRSHDESNDIISFDILSSSPESVGFADEVVIDANNGYVYPLYVEGDMPFSIDAAITISDSARFLNEPEMPLSFSSSEPTLQYTVVAASGKEKDWIISPIKPRLISGSDPNVTYQEKRYTGVDEGSFSYQLANGGNDGFTVYSYNVDDANETITFTLKKDGHSFQSIQDGHSVDFDIDFDVLDGMQMYGISFPTTLSFSSIADEYSFYLIDNYSLTMRQWTVKIESWLSSETNLNSFNFTLSTGSTTILSGSPDWFKPFITVNSNAVIDNSRAEVYVEATSVVVPGTIDAYLNPWYADINVRSTSISYGATINIANSYNFTDSGLGEVKNFTITAEDGTTREWKLFIKPSWGPKSALCDIESFVISEVSDNHVLVNATFGQGDTILINIDGGLGYLPVTITPSVMVSQYATTPNWTYGQGITISYVDQIIDFLVVAEDGTTSKTWKLKVVDCVPPSLAGAEVAGFSITSSNPSSVIVGGVDIDSETATININLSSIGSFSNGYNVSYNMTISDGASLTNALLRGTFTFANIMSENSFIVEAENGETKEWTVKLSYLPQLTNWNFNAWSGNNATGWANANNSFTTGTTRTSGASGEPNDYAVRLYTSLAPIVNKIAAGSIFLGEFKFDMSQQNDPPLMTWFGIPFTSTRRLIAVEADVNYTAGGGTDVGSISVDLIHYSGSGVFEYHGYDHSGNRNATGVLMKKELIHNTNGWVTIHVDLDYSNARDLDITHLSINFSSGAYGDLFQGEAGSLLMVDNVRLIYE